MWQYLWKLLPQFNRYRKLQILFAAAKCSIEAANLCYSSFQRRGTLKWHLLLQLEKREAVASSGQIKFVAIKLLPVCSDKQNMATKEPRKTWERVLSLQSRFFFLLQNSLPCLHTQNVKLLLQDIRLQLSDKSCLLVTNVHFSSDKTLHNA